MLVLYRYIDNSVKYKAFVGSIKLISPRLVTSDCNLICFTIIINMMTTQTQANLPVTIVDIFDSYLENMGVWLDSLCLDFLPSSLNLLTISVKTAGICNGPFTFSNSLTGKVCSIHLILGFTDLANLGLYCFNICQKAKLTVNLRVRSQCVLSPQVLICFKILAYSMSS